MSPDYIPSDEDILHTRVRTVGIVEHEFELKDKTGPHSGKVIMVRYGVYIWITDVYGDNPALRFGLQNKC